MPTPKAQRSEVANVYEVIILLNNNNATLKKLIKSSFKCNPKSKTNFSFAFHLRSGKSWKVIPFINMKIEYTICVPYMTQTGFCK